MRFSASFLSALRALGCLPVPVLPSCFSLPGAHCSFRDASRISEWTHGTMAPCSSGAGLLRCVARCTACLHSCGLLQAATPTGRSSGSASSDGPLSLACCVLGWDLCLGPGHNHLERGVKGFRQVPLEILTVNRSQPCVRHPARFRLLYARGSGMRERLERPMRCCTGPPTVRRAVYGIS